MKRKFTFLTAALALLAFLAIPLGMRGQTSNYVFNTAEGLEALGIEVPTAGQGTVLGENTYTVGEITMSSTDGGTPTRVWNSSGTLSLRIYKNNNGANGTLTFIASEGNTISQIVISKSSGTLTANAGTYVNQTGTWTGSANSVTFTCTVNATINTIEVTYSSGTVPTLEDSDLALTDAPVALSFDLYDNADAQVIHYTTSSTGAVTVSQSDFVTTVVNETAKTITVTPVAVTPDTQTLTVAQVADGTYNSGQVTFTIDVEDSTPAVTFVAGTDMGSSSSNGSSDEMTKDGVTVSGSDAAFATAQYRLYQNSVTTVSVTVGTITRIVFKGVSGYPASRLSLTSESSGTYSTSGNDGTWTGNAQSISFSASAQARLSQIVVIVENGGTPDPSITAANVGIAYDDEAGSIAYEIIDGVEGGVLTAEITSSTIEELALGQVGATSIPFTCSPNDDVTSSRTATVTLTYTYNNEETVTKEVTITQAVAPLVYTTIPALFAAATTSEQTVMVTFNGWVVTGVSTNGKYVFVTDGNGNGLVIYSSSSLADTYEVGNTLTGTVECTLKLNAGYARLSNVPSNELTIGTGGSVEFSEIEMANLAGVNTGALVQYENLTCSVNNNNYFLSDGTTTIQVYNSLFAFEALEAGHVYNISGVYQQYNSTKEILPRSADDIEEVVAPAEPSITFDPDVIELSAEEHIMEIPFTYENIEVADYQSFTVHYYNAEGEEIQLGEDRWHVLGVTGTNEEGYNVTGYVSANDGEARTAYFKVSAQVAANNTVYSNLVTINQAAPVAPFEPATYTLANSIESGKTYIIVGRNSDDYAMGGQNNNNRAAAEISIDGTTATVESEDVYEFVITALDDEGFYSIYDARTPGYLYAASKSANQLKTKEDLDVNGNWEITFDAETGAASIVASNSENRNVMQYNNGSHLFSCYSSASQSLVYLYVKDDASTPAIVLNTYAINVDSEEHDGTVTVTYRNVDPEAAEVVVCDAEGETTTYTWFDADFDENHNVFYTIDSNTGEARTAYFKVYGLDAEANDVYSNLVTISQAAAPQQYNLTVSLNENVAAIFVFDDPNGDPLIENGAAGNVQVVEGTTIIVSPDVEEGYLLASLIVNNVDVTSQLDESGAYTFTMPANDVTIGATAVEDIPFEGATYTLATTIENGRHYIIVGKKTVGDETSYFAMGQQNNNNRKAVSIDVEDGVATVSSDEVRELVFNNWLRGTNPSGNTGGGFVGEEAIGDYYTIYDPEESGYLYAVSSSSNYLRTQTFNNANGEWVISFDGDVASIIAYEVQVGNEYSTKIMRYNSSNSIFSCYGENNTQLDVYLYVKVEETPQYDFYKDIAGYNSGEDWYLLASPLTTDITPEAAGMITDDNTDPENLTYDLYSFDFTEQQEWRNYRVEAFNLTNGEGWLYANKNDVTLHFSGNSVGNTTTATVPLNYSTTTAYDFNGLNLVGNPLTFSASLDNAHSNYYVMNKAGNEIIAVSGYAINPMQGAFVQAASENESVTFSKYTYDWGGELLNLRVSGDNNVVDHAIVNFGQGQHLEKFQLNPNHTKIYFTQGSKDYAIVRSANEGEMPVSFKAETNVTYTISVNADNVEMNYLHLIDNLTGADVDLLATPSYSFEANTNDYATRFRLVFKANANVHENADADTFAFFNGNEWVVSNIGEATLQVVDVMGRVLSSETINGNAEISINQTPGVYMLRLINGDNVKTQKVVVR